MKITVRRTATLVLLLQLPLAACSNDDKGMNPPPDNGTVSPTHVWSQRFGDTSGDLATGIVVDWVGNILITGSFESTLDLGGGPLVSAGDWDIFVAKYDASGTHLWSKRFGGTARNLSWDMVVDGAGNIVVTGTFQGTVDFGGGPLTSAGEFDIFVAKFDASGTHLWSKRFGDTGGDYGNGVAVDGAGNVLVTGSFRGTVDFGGGSLTSGANADIFVAKYDASGAHLWSNRFGYAGSTLYGSDSGESIAVDGSGNVVVTGYFSDTIDFGGGPLVSAGSADIFVAKFDPNGVHVWSRRSGSASPLDAGHDVTVDGSGNVLVTGDFEGTVDFGGGPVTSAGDWDIFVAKYDANGTHLWSKRFGDPDFDRGKHIAVDGAGNVAVTGMFKGVVDFGGGPINEAGGEDIFVVKFDASGAHLWSRRFGDPANDMDGGIAVNGAGDILVTGSFQGTVDFGGGPLTSAGDHDVFVVKLSDE